MKYETGKHLEYVRWLIDQKRSPEDICYDLIGKWMIDSNLRDILAEGRYPEADIFDLAVRYLDRGYKEEKEQNFQKLLDILDVSSPKK